MSKGTLGVGGKDGPVGEQRVTLAVCVLGGATGLMEKARKSTTLAERHVRSSVARVYSRAESCSEPNPAFAAMTRPKHACRSGYARRRCLIAQQASKTPVCPISSPVHRPHPVWMRHPAALRCSQAVRQRLRLMLLSTPQRTQFVSAQARQCPSPPLSCRGAGRCRITW